MSALEKQGIPFKVAITYFAMNAKNASDRRRLDACRKLWQTKGSLARRAVRKTLRIPNRCIDVDVVTGNKVAGRAGDKHLSCSFASVARSGLDLLQFFASYDAVFIIFDHALLTEATVMACLIDSMIVGLSLYTNLSPAPTKPRKRCTVWRLHLTNPTWLLSIFNCYQICTASPSP